MMDLDKFNLIKYSDFEFNDNLQNVGIFIDIERYGDVLTDELIDFLKVFEDYSLNFVPAIISEFEIESVKKDILQDNFLFDIIIIHDIYFDLDFLESLISKANLFGVKVIYSLNNFDGNLFVESESMKFAANHADQIIVNNIDARSFLKKLNDNVLIIYNSSSPNNISVDEKYFTSWFEVLNSSKRDVNSLLYKYFTLFIKDGTITSFHNFLDEKSHDIIVDSHLFDEEWYLSQYPDVKQINCNPITHYLSLGVYENCLPNVDFYPNSDFKGNTLNPFVSFILYECIDKPDDYFIIKSSGLFDEEWYLSQNPNIHTDPILHFLDVGSDNNCNPSKDFDISWYLDNYIDVKNSNINPFVHYIKYGQYEDKFPNRFSYYDVNAIDKKDIERNMEILDESGLFDENRYLEKYVDVKNSRFTGLEHYVRYGFNESYRSPNDYFSSIFYKNAYLNGPNENWNPLTHYALVGQYKNNKVNIFDIDYKNYNPSQLRNIFNAFEKQISIVLFLFNEPTEYLNECIKSLKNNTHLEFNLFIINYTKFEVNLNSDEDIYVFDYYSPTFSEDIKVSLMKSNNDFFFLTEYTKVTYKWLEKLIIKAYSEEEIDIVTPISNIYGISPEKYNSIISPKNLTVDGLSKLIERISLNNHVEIPFINLSGVYVKNKVISLNNFNINSFGFNSEENLFGWIMDESLLNVLDDSTYIYFNLDFFDNLLTRFSNNGTGWELSYFYNDVINWNQIENVSDNIEYSISHVTNKYLSNRILFVLDQDDLLFYNDFLTYYNKDYFEFYFLTVNSENIDLYKIYNDEFIKLKEFDIKFKNEEIMKNNVQNIFFNIITSLNADAIQLNNLNFHANLLVDVVNSLRLPLIYECDDKFEDSLKQDLNKSKSIDEYINMHENILTNSDRIIVSSQTVKSNLEDLDFSLNDESIEVLNVSYLNEVQFKLSNYNESECVKILIPGNLNEFSDSQETIRYIDNHDDFLVEFHFLGEVPYLNGCGFNHGEFSKKSLKRIVNDISPDFIGLFSVFDNIFQVIDISIEENIPIILCDDNLLVGMVDGFDGVNVIRGDDVSSLLNSVRNILCFDNYFKNIKEMYMQDSRFKNEIVSFNKLHEDMYLSFGDSSKKIVIRKPHENKPKDNYKELFPNFAGFLANSYVSPMFEADFTEEYKECFAVMDNVSKFLINKVRNSEVKPLVSIIMPAYNREKVILSAINSVLNQSYENFELIIIDDCSTDNTVKMLNNVDDERISIILREENGGASKARNTGLKEANGEFIAYLDSDNEWDSRYLESMVGAFLHLPDADAIYSGQLLYEEYDSNPFAVRFGAYNKSLLLNHNYIDLNCFCHKLSIFNEIGGFDSELYRLEDWDFILRISNDYKMYSVPVLLSKYYYHNAENRISDLSIEFLNYTDLIHERNKRVSKCIDFNLNKKVNIIIPNYESLKDLRECVDAILSFDLDKVKLIIVDNDSCDAVKFYLNTLKSNDKIEVLLNEFNYGFTYAVNQGIEMSEPGADILLLNNDAILTEGAIQAMQKFAYDLPNCGIVVPQQVLPGETPTLNVHVPYASPIHECDVNPSQHHQNIINMPLFHDGEILELNFAPFFCTYIKRDVLDESVGLDAELGRHYRSDRIYSDYVREVMGLKIYHTSDALVYHKLQKSTAKLRENKDDFNIMFVKNQWEPEIMDKLGYKKALWDD